MMRYRHPWLIVILLAPIACFELTAVSVEPTDPRLGVVLETHPTGRIELHVLIHPGTDELGVARRLASDSLRINGISYAATEETSDGGIVFAVDSIGSLDTPLEIEVPTLASSPEPLELVVSPLGVIPVDTLRAIRGGAFELAVIGAADPGVEQFEHWSVIVTWGDGGRVTVSGTQLRDRLSIPTTLLPADADEGVVRVDGRVASRTEVGPYDATVHRVFSAVIPFSLSP